ncbi:MAG: NAD(+)/NADH kinase [Polyangiaceae bacterium]
MRTAGRTPQVCVVLKRSSWRKWVEEEGDSHIVNLLEAGDETVQRMRPGHIAHVETVEEVRSALAELGANVLWNDRPHEFTTDDVGDRCDLVVTVGGDGTLLGASHGIGGCVPLLGVNSAPEYSIGFFCAAKKGGVRAAIAAALDGSLERTELTRMCVDLNGRRLLNRVLNEALFCHSCPAATSRYILRIEEGAGGAQEEHKSSGLWVGPAAGSTAAQRSAGGSVLPLTSSSLQYVVREPYRPNGEPPRMRMGLVGESNVLSIKSRMRQARVFLDGEHLVHDVTIGDVVTMKRSDEPLIVLGLTRSA